MTQAEIRAERVRLDAEVKKHRREIEVLTAQRAVLEKRCDHPRIHDTCHMGDMGVKCPDCGYAR